MKSTISIHPYSLDSKSKMQFYSFLMQGEDTLEVDKFYNRFNIAPYDTSVKEIQALIHNMGTEFGAQERFFRKEGLAHALPSNAYHKPLLRLYCLRCCEQVVILGNGGIKESNKAKDSPDCYPHFLIMNAIAQAFRKMQVSCCDLPKKRMPFSLSIIIPD